MPRVRISALLIASAVLLPRVLAAATATTPTSGEMNAHFINVGQGGSVLLEFSCGAALIDTGGEANGDFNSTTALTAYLDAFFARRTDLRKTLALVIVSHPHIDHTRGLPAVLSQYSVEAFVDDGLETGSGGRQQKAAHQKARDSRIPYLGVTQRSTANPTKRPTPPGKPFANCGTVPAFEFLWGALDARDGWAQTILKNQNDSSVVTRVQFGKTSFLFPGDLEEDVQDDFIKQACPSATRNCPLDVDILLVAHHGSHNGTTPELLEAATPHVAVIEMGPFDRQGTFSALGFGHPRDVAIKRLLDPSHGVTDKRQPTAQEEVAHRAAASKSGGPEFTKIPITQAVYGTGWADDDNIVIAAKADGTFRVLSKVTP
jgi:competence protein ComEC